MKEMHKQGLRNVGGELETVSVSQILAKLENCTFPQIRHLRKGSSDCDSCSWDFRASIAEIRSQAQQAFYGLCLDCIKYGNKGGEMDVVPCIMDARGLGV